jgi:hypothetical protein
MKSSINLALCLLLVVTSFSGIEAQQSQAARITSDSNEYREWRKIDVGIFEFHAPKELKGGKRQGIDSRVWKYESADLVLDIDAGLYSGFPSVERTGATYREMFLTVDGASAWMWFYEDPKNELRYVSGANFSFKGLNESVTIELNSKDIKGQEIAEKMFKSVKFKFKRIPNRPELNRSTPPPDFGKRPSG